MGIFLLRRDWAQTPTREAHVRTWEKMIMDKSWRGLGRSQPCRHVGLRLLASRTMRTCVSVVYGCGTLYDSDSLAQEGLWGDSLAWQREKPLQSVGRPVSQPSDLSPGHPCKVSTKRLGMPPHLLFPNAPK